MKEIFDAFTAWLSTKNEDEIKKHIEFVFNDSRVTFDYYNNIVNIEKLGCVYCLENGDNGPYLEVKTNKRRK